MKKKDLLARIEDLETCMIEAHKRIENLHSRSMPEGTATRIEEMIKYLKEFQAKFEKMKSEFGWLEQLNHKFYEHCEKFEELKKLAEQREVWQQERISSLDAMKLKIDRLNERVNDLTKKDKPCPKPPSSATANGRPSRKSKRRTK